MNEVSKARKSHAVPHFHKIQEPPLESTWFSPPKPWLKFPCFSLLPPLVFLSLSPIYSHNSKTKTQYHYHHRSDSSISHKQKQSRWAQRAGRGSWRRASAPSRRWRIRACAAGTTPSNPFTTMARPSSDRITRPRTSLRPPLPPLPTTSDDLGRSRWGKSWIWAASAPALLDSRKKRKKTHGSSSSFDLSQTHQNQIQIQIPFVGCRVCLISDLCVVLDGFGFEVC